MKYFMKYCVLVHASRYLEVHCLLPSLSAKVRPATLTWVVVVSKGCKLNVISCGTFLECKAAAVRNPLKNFNDAISIVR